MTATASLDWIRHLDAHPDRVAILDQDGRIVYVNDAWRRAVSIGWNDARQSSEGDNYLEACHATSESCRSGAELLHGLSLVLEGIQASFQLTYGQESDLTLASVSRLGFEAAGHVLVRHIDAHPPLERSPQAAQDLITSVSHELANTLMAMEGVMSGQDMSDESRAQARALLADGRSLLRYLADPHRGSSDRTELRAVLSDALAATMERTGFNYRLDISGCQDTTDVAAPLQAVDLMIRAAIQQILAGIQPGGLVRILVRRSEPRGKATLELSRPAIAPDIERVRRLSDEDHPPVSLRLAAARRDATRYGGALEMGILSDRLVLRLTLPLHNSDDEVIA